MPLPCYRVIQRKATGQWKRNWAVRRCGPGSGCRFLIQPEKTEPSSITGDVQQRRERTTHLLASTRLEREDNVLEKTVLEKKKMSQVEEREKRRVLFLFWIWNSSPCMLLKIIIPVWRLCRCLFIQSKSIRCIFMTTDGRKPKRITCSTCANVSTCGLLLSMIAMITNSTE